MSLRRATVWTHALCESCWRTWASDKFGDPDREPVRLRDGAREEEYCGSCGKVTSSGIYVRADPATMPYGRCRSCGLAGGAHKFSCRVGYYEG